jgi:hypothetical protein
MVEILVGGHRTRSQKNSFHRLRARAVSRILISMSLTAHHFAFIQDDQRYRRAIWDKPVPRANRWSIR